MRKLYTIAAFAITMIVGWPSTACAELAMEPEADTTLTLMASGYQIEWHILETIELFTESGFTDPRCTESNLDVASLTCDITGPSTQPDGIRQEQLEISGGKITVYLVMDPLPGQGTSTNPHNCFFVEDSDPLDSNPKHTVSCNTTPAISH